MKSNIVKKVIFLVLLCTTVISIWSFGTSNEITNDKNKVLVGILRSILKRGHFEPKEMNDQFSKEVFEEFIKEMDPFKRYFTKGDIATLAKYQLEIDDQLKREDISYYNDVKTLFDTKFIQSQNLYKNILSKPFRFDLNEKVNVDFENIDFSKDENELKERWRKQLKLNTLNKLDLLIEEEKDKKKKDSTYTKRKFKLLEAEARKSTLENMDDLYKRIGDFEPIEWFSTFLNVVVAQFDPHTVYFAPKIKEQFDINMSGKIEGIGARLQSKNDFTKVVELISGGPAWKQGDLEVGDVILKVAQKDKKAIDIVGMRLDNAIKLIKGKKGTDVILTVKKVDNSIKHITITRDVVELEETFVKSAIINRDNKKLGIIHLPKFYINFQDKDFRNSSTDMKKEVELLKKEGVDGILLDLRNNGGGSLKTAVEIAGLFIDKGPIVQVKYRDSRPEIKQDTDNKIFWDKPLVIMVNEFSASASEILAAAMQDHKRAVIIGSKNSYGKGTVQNIIPINSYYNYPEDLGALKLTIQKFYRINGGTTQLRGVESDIVLPTKYDYIETGEKELKNPLKWDQIEPADYTKRKYYTNRTRVIEDATKKLNSNIYLKQIVAYSKWLDSEQNDNSYNLKMSTFLDEKNKHNKEAKAFEKNKKFISSYQFQSTNSEKLLIEKDSVLGIKRKNWHKKLKGDVYIDLGLDILSELKMTANQLIVQK